MKAQELEDKYQELYKECKDSLLELFKTTEKYDFTKQAWVESYTDTFESRVVFIIQEEIDNQPAVELRNENTGVVEDFYVFKIISEGIYCTPALDYDVDLKFMSYDRISNPYEFITLIKEIEEL